MKISIIHPTRGRRSLMFQTLSDWLYRADNVENIEYLLSVDTDDPIEYDQIHECIEGVDLRILRNNNRNAIQAINHAAEFATHDLLIVVSDDFECPKQWDTDLLKALEGKEDFLVKTQDGIQPTLITLPIMDRKYYERFGYIYNPIYRHMFADTEMTAVGMMLGRVINVPMLFKHNHYSVGGIQKDRISERNNATWKTGKQIFNVRRKSGFGITDKVMRYEDIKWH